MKEDGEEEMKFPWVEIGIFLSAGSLVGILAYPQYKASRTMEKEAKVLYNLHAFQVSLERYALYHEGDFPRNVQQVEPYFDPPNSYPLNSYTQEHLREGEIQFFSYPYSGENRDNTVTGIYGSMSGPPGGIAVGIFFTPVDSLIPLDSLLVQADSLVDVDSLAQANSLVTEYGITGFNQDGNPLTKHDPARRDYIIILRNE